MAGPIEDLPDGRWKVKLTRPAGAGAAFCDVVGWAELAIELCANLLIVRDPKAMNATRRRVSDLTFDAGHTMLGDAESEFVYNYRERAGTYKMIIDGLRQAGAQIDAIVDAVPDFLGETRTFIRAVTNELGKGVRDPHFAVRELAHMAARARYIEDYGEAGLRTNATARATAKAYGVRIDARTQLQLYQARVGESMPIDAQYFDRFPPDVRDVVISYTYGQAGELSLQKDLVERFLVQERIQAATPPSNLPRR